MSCPDAVCYCHAKPAYHRTFNPATVQDEYEEKNVEDWASLIAVAAAFVGLVIGYFMGYRSGSVSGELTALKSLRQSHRGREPRRGRKNDVEPED